MSFTSWLHNLRSALASPAVEGRHRRQRSRRATTHRPGLEVLEDRCLPSTFMVLNLNDSGADSLRAAITAANANSGPDAIDFATTGTIALTSGQLDITDSLTINGPGASALTVYVDALSRAFDITGSTTNVQIRDLTITEGFPYYGGSGGAIYNTAVLTVSNCTLSGNYNLARGGGGGAIYNAGTLTVSDSTLSDNYSYGVGGAIYNAGTLTVSDSTLSGNSSAYAGGAIYNAGALTVSNSTLSGNSVFDSNGYGSIGYGGAVYMAAGSLSLSSSTLCNNTAGGGYYYYTDFEAGIQNAFIASDAYGGGLYCAGGTVSIDHSTLADNAAWVYTSDPGYPPATSYGGGIYNVSGSALQVYDSIIAGNGADVAPDFIGITSLGHNLFGNSNGAGGFPASDLLDVDPRLGPLQDNGGPTQTMALLAGSPAINAGDNTGAPAYDQRGPGFPRSFGGAIDIGAFESPSPLPPAVSISDVSLSEGNVGATAAVFTVRLSAASTQTVSVHYTTADGSATATDNDYQAQSDTLTFAPGETSRSITVLVNGDRLAESNETFAVNLTPATSAVIIDGQGVGTIVDDEPRISVSDVTRTEGNTGTTLFAFTVSLSAAYDAPVTVSFATADGVATAGSDYQATSGTLTFAPSETSKTVTVQVIGDRLAEANEAFVVNLSSPTNAALSDGQGVGTILDDEPRISITDVTMAEGRKGKTTLFTFTVTLSAAYDQAVTLSFRTVDGTATTGNNDYAAKTGTLTFAPGETTKTITIEVKGDSKREANETFYLELFGNSSNASFTKNRGIGTILNDD
jgi:hypothetical protein